MISKKYNKKRNISRKLRNLKQRKISLKKKGGAVEEEEEIQGNIDDNIELPVKGDLLGKGAFGIVYRSTFEKKPCVVKELKIKEGLDNTDINKKNRKDLLNEYKIIKSLDHPNIVSTLGVQNPGNKK
jgi:hypothetical protein